jgi:sulfur carrier protein ThiS
MQVTVRLYGILEQQVPGYDHRTGLVQEVAEGTTVAQLLTRLKIPLKKVGMVSLNGHLAGKDDTLQDSMQVKVFHPIFGG